MASFYKALISLILIIFGATACAQDTPPINPDVLPRCDGPFNLCGYVDAAQWKSDRTNKYVIPPTYQSANGFTEGLAGVRIKGKWGFINVENKLVIKPRFDLVGRFHNGLAEVLVDNKIGIIGMNGAYKIKPQYARAVPMTEDLIVIKQGDWVSIHMPGRDTLETFGGPKGQPYSLKKGVLSKQGFAFVAFDKENSDLLWAKSTERKSLWGLMDTDGSWKIEPRFATVASISEGRAVVSEPASPPHNSNTTNLWGALDNTGKVVVPIEFGRINGWRESWGEFSLVHKAHEKGTINKRGRLKGLIDKQGNLIGERYFNDHKFPRRAGQYHAVSEDGKWLRVAPDGTLGRDNGYEAFTCDNGLSMINYADSVEFITPDGTRVGDTKFEENYKTEKDCGKPIWVKSGDKQSFVMPDGSILGGALNFENAYNFSGGIAAVKIGGKWGVIRLDGTYAIAPKYEELRPFGPDVFRINKRDAVSYISSNGETVPEPKATAADKASYLQCRGGARLMTVRGKWGMVDEDGKSLIPGQYPIMSCFKRGVAWVPDYAKGAWCPIDQTGKRAKAPACKTKYYPYNQTHSFPERLNSDPFKSSVLWTTAFYEYGAGLRDELPRMIPERYNGYSDEEIAKIPTKDLRMGTYSTSPN